jgi:nucleoside-diphosphate-sugar epimerase
MRKNVFVAGATGAIGSPLVRLLISRGYRVFALTRKEERSASLWDLGAVPVVADALDSARMVQVFRAIRPDAVVHQLTDLPVGLDPSKMEEAVRRNAHIRREGTANLVKAALSTGVVPFVAQSIAWAYKAGKEPHAEDSPFDLDAQGLRAVSVGGVMALERAVLDASALQGCVLRYGQIYGPGTGSENAGDKASPLHVEAAAWAAVLALEKGAIGAYNVAEINPNVKTNKAHNELGWHESMRV